MSLTIIAILIVVGILVGFINTLSAGGTTITIALYLALGLPPQSANAVNRVGVLLQNGFGSLMFWKKGSFKLKEVLPYAIPIMVGAFFGSILAVEVSEKVFSVCFGLILILMLVFMSLGKYVKPKQEKVITTKKYLLYLPIFIAIGCYGGFVQSGTGFPIIAAFSLLLGYDLVKTTGVKLASMFLYTIVAISVFFVRGGVQIEYWIYGLIHSLGMILGTWIAGKYAIKKGEGIVKLAIIIVIVITALYLLGIVDFGNIFKKILV